MPERFPPSEPFARFLAASIAALHREAPASARAVEAALGAAAVELVVDGERLVIRGRPALAVAPVRPDAVAAEVHVATTARALVALLDGGDELTPAIVDNRVRVRAAPGDAAQLFDAMRGFVEGCARTTSAPELLVALRRQVGSTQNRRRT